RIPHKVRIERGVDGHGRTPLIARPAAIRADHAIVINADGNRLSVTKSTRGRVAAGAGVVTVQAADGVEPEQPAKICPPWINAATKTAFESGFNFSRKAQFPEPPA